MKTLRALPLITLAFGASCTDLSLPIGAQVSCSVDGDCPSGFLCRADAKRCIDATIIGKTPIAFAVEEIALVRSTLSPEGARYDTVSTFACR